jgi:formylglycine-generating enzyme required for sulfatase activity
MAILFTLAAGLAMAAGDETITNSIGMKLLRVAPGTFVMGQEAGGDFDERPAHKVVISLAFHLAATEVTNAQYERFDPNHARLRGKKGFAKDDDEAVVFVSWHDAVRFCQWLTKKEGRPYRLPTEAEWEYACRAGTTTAFHTGDTLPQEYCKNQKADVSATPVPLHVARTAANAWGLHDMHGNVEEWCQDWYGPYAPGEQTDPVGPAAGDFRVTRGGSHGTEVRFLRSANRMGTLPEDAHWMIGFRVVMGEPPKTRMGTGTATANDAPLRSQSPVWGLDVSQARCDWAVPAGYAADKPYFRGPRQYVNVPAGSDGPMFSKHNHEPAIAGCPNGDLLAIWYSCRSEEGRELAVLAARLRRGADQWDPPAVFWDAPDRNDHGSDLWWDGAGTMYHFNGLSTDMGWGKLALLMRTSTDSGATWSPARLIGPEHGLRHQVIAGGFRTSKGVLVVKCDAATGGSGGSAVHVSDDGGRTWTDPGAGKAGPAFAAGATGA